MRYVKARLVVEQAFCNGSIGLSGMSPSIKTRLASVVLTGFLLCGAWRQAQATDNHYQVQTTVTGQGEENRAVGFERCFEDVLIKVSGLMQLAGDARLNAHKANAGRFVQSFTYVDQMSGKPKRDEQGTRDRPYDLIVDFDKDKINEVLAELNVKPWLSPRPVLAVVVAMHLGGVTYVVSSDSKRSELQKEALVAAANKRGIQIVLPGTATWEKLNLADLGAMPGSAAMVEQGGKAALVGRLTWLDQELKWRAKWKLVWKGRLHRWQFGAMTFDEVFRRGLGDAVQILAQDH